MNSVQENNESFVVEVRPYTALEIRCSLSLLCDNVQHLKIRSELENKTIYRRFKAG